MPKQNIVWLASYPKSGNTWFRVFLQNILLNSNNPININELDTTYLASSRSLFDQITAISSSDLSTEEIEILRPDVYRSLAESIDETIFMKVHDAWTLNQAGKPLFPYEITSSVIYIIRHPLDVAVSLSYHNSENVINSLSKMEKSTYGFCLGKKRLFNQLPQRLLSWAEHVNSWVFESGLNVHVIKYEDMLQMPNIAFSKALDFLKISYTPARLEKAISNSSFNSLQEQENKVGFSEKPINAKTFFRKGIRAEWIKHIDQTTANDFLHKNKEIINLFY